MSTVNSVKGYVGGCKCCCNLGSLIPRWQNVTMVRPTGDTLGPNYTATPYGRDQTAAVCSNSPLPPAGTCGTWLAGGDLLGLDAQVIQGGYNDIQTCAAGDSTHTTADHNCYVKNASVAASAVTSGGTYTILTVGTTDWTTIGAASNTVGVTFTATGAGTGTGTAQPVVDMRTGKLFGGQWVFGRKLWHGALPWDSTDACTPSAATAANPPTQTRYCSFNVLANWTNTRNVGPVGQDTQQWTTQTISGQYAGSMTVNPQSGVRTLAMGAMKQSNVTESSGGGPPFTITTAIDVSNGIGIINQITETDGTVIQAGTDVGPNYMIQYDTDDTINLPMHAITDFYCGSVAGGKGPIASLWTNGWTMQSYDQAGNANGTVTVMPTGTATNWSINGTQDTYWGQNYINAKYQVTGTQVTYSISWGIYGPDNTGAGSQDTYNATFSATLGAPYSATDCYTDGIAALNSVDMSNMNAMKFRTDEQLANSLCVMYDEVPSPVVPDMVYSYGLPNYGNPIEDGNGYAPWTYTYGGTSPGTGWTEGPSTQIDNWGETFGIMSAWIDPNNSQWEYTDYNGRTWTGAQPIYWSGASLQVPMRSGEIIPQNQPGSDRHFWFGYPDYEITDCGPDGPPAPAYTWELKYLGGSSDSNIPSIATRWLDKLTAQYDGGAGCGSTNAPPGAVMPQSFISQIGTTLYLGKFVQAVQTWDAINPGRPCGPDKYAVDQTLVGCVTGTTVTQNSSDGTSTSGTFTISQNTGGTWNSTNPPPSGGYVIVSGSYAPGLYHVLGVSGTGPWTVSVSSVVDSQQIYDGSTPTGTYDFGIPTGFQMTTGTGDFIGWLRFPTYPGICGRVEITTSYSSPTLTINTADQPYLRVGTTGSISVDLYDSSMTLLAAAVSLTRVNDGQFTATAGPYPTAAYMVSAGVDWTKFNPAIHNRTGVLQQWSFDLRKPNTTGYIKGSMYAGSGGCTGCNVSQFNYVAAKCLAVVGIVPFNASSPTGLQTPTDSETPPASTPIENFPNQVLFPMPDTVAFDSVYNSLWVGQVKLTMPDPLWQTPFNPFCGSAGTWTEDDGTGHTNTKDGSGNPVDYYAHRPLVEATTSSAGLPAGIYSQYDPTENVFYPPAYNGNSAYGIPVASSGSSAYGSVAMDWGFALNACATIASSGNFGSIYATFVYC